MPNPVSLRLSPTNSSNDITGCNPAATFAKAIGELNRLIESPGDPIAFGKAPACERGRPISCSFAQLFLANP
jgi:hypothetical protein